MKKWLYENKEFKTIEDFPSGIVGFVYKITNLCDGRIYIGRKILYNKLTKLLTKREITEWEKPGRVPKKKKVVKESDWQSYWGSNKQIKEDLQTMGEECFKREILVLCKNKKQLSYYEVYWQMKLDVLAIDSYNENIAGKFFRKDLE
jgi:hypothetical protein